MKLIKKLKKYNPTLYQIHEFMVKAKELGYGEVVFHIKTHDYVSKVIEMEALKPKKKGVKNIAKKVIKK